MDFSYFIMSCLYCILQGPIEFFVYLMVWAHITWFGSVYYDKVLKVSYRWLDVLFNTRRAFPLIFVSSCKVLQSWLRVVYVLLLRCSSDNPLVAEGPGAMNFWNIPPSLQNRWKFCQLKSLHCPNTSRPTSGNPRIHSKKIYSGAFL